MQAMQEAQEYADECRLPAAFAPELLNQIQSTPVKGAWEEFPDNGLPPHKPLGTEKRPVPLLAAHEIEQAPGPRRRLAVQRQLGLAAPWSSPYRAAAAQPPPPPAAGAQRDVAMA
jgi:hypothetical protein